MKLLTRIDVPPPVACREQLLHGITSQNAKESRVFAVIHYRTERAVRVSDSRLRETKASYASIVSSFEKALGRTSMLNEGGSEAPTFDLRDTLGW